MLPGSVCCKILCGPLHLSRYVCLGCTRAVFDVSWRVWLKAYHPIYHGLIKVLVGRVLWRSLIQPTLDCWVRAAGARRAKAEKLKSFQGWSPLLSGCMSQGCTTLLQREFFLMPYLNWPGCNFCLLLYVTVPLTYWKDLGSILPVFALQVNVDF